MSWTMTAVAVALAGLAVAATAMIGKWMLGRMAASRRIAAGGGDASLYGLSSEDAARLHRSAREQMHRHQAQWSRDYLPGVTDGALPGRVAGIPRALRVRR